MVGRKRGFCKECGKENILVAKGMCNNCYKRVGVPIMKCVKCGKEKHHHAFGLCANCYLKTHQYDSIKKYARRKYHNISLELWKELTKECVVCKFDKTIDLHHLDGNRQNNSKNNLIGLCPNHHRMIHDSRYGGDVLKQIKEKQN